MDDDRLMAELNRCRAEYENELPTLIEHVPYVGPEFKTKGIEGQRIAIVLWSHWFSEGDVDNNAATLEDMAKIIDGTYRIRAFTSIRNFFGYDDHATFWRRVMFFNYLPNSVGGPDRRFGDGTAEQICCAKARFLKLLWTIRPTKALVFTSRRWAFLPAQEAPLGDRFSSFTRRVYRDPQSGHAVTTFFLRHPQGANGELMRDAVRHVLDEP